MLEDAPNVPTLLHPALLVLYCGCGCCCCIDGHACVDGWNACGEAVCEEGLNRKAKGSAAELETGFDWDFIVWLGWEEPEVGLANSAKRSADIVVCFARMFKGLV